MGLCVSVICDRRAPVLYDPGGETAFESHTRRILVRSLTSSMCRRRVFLDLAVRSGAALKSLANGDLRPGVSAQSFDEIHSFQVLTCAGTLTQAACSFMASRGALLARQCNKLSTPCPSPHAFVISICQRIYGRWIALIIHSKCCTG